MAVAEIGKYVIIATPEPSGESPFCLDVEWRPVDNEIFLSLPEIERREQAVTNVLAANGLGRLMLKPTRTTLSVTNTSFDG